VGDRARGAPLSEPGRIDTAAEPWAAIAGTDVTAAARALLGCELHAAGVVVRLTEVEAYSGDGADPASHAHRGRTRRNAVMFGPPGHAYVYFVFGMHWCLNVVCGPPGQAAAVLLRAGEVRVGASLARQRRRATHDHNHDHELARGPARLVVALGIGPTANGTSLFDGSGPLTIKAPPRPVDPTTIRSGPRVGVALAADVPWRYWLDGEPSVSQYRRHTPRRRPDRPTAGQPTADD
jgi:DNA-3-methyladenine glycosylase